MLYLTQPVCLNDGEQRTFQAFEDLAIPLMSKYRGELLLRVRPYQEGAEAMFPPERVMEGVTIALVRAPGGVPIGFSGP